MGDPELLSMLATEAERRTPTIITGLEELAASGEKDSARIEELRVEAHGLKGAALVVGQEPARRPRPRSSRSSSPVVPRPA